MSAFAAPKIADNPYPPGTAASDFYLITTFLVARVGADPRVRHPLNLLLDMARELHDGAQRERHQAVIDAIVANIPRAPR